jgi:hypothetical protein
MLIGRRVNEVAAEISGVPVGVLYNIIHGRSIVYCRCEALKKILDNVF